MITRVEIDGFKTFQDLKLDLSPFQVIVGANGVGKSNLFDALQLLSILVDTDLRSAFRENRGKAMELFTILFNGQIVNEMSLAVEMLVDRSVVDSWGSKAELEYTRMRYELAITRGRNERGLEGLYVSHESLKAIPRGEDNWSKRHKLSAQNNWLPKPTGSRPPFISTEVEAGQNAIHLHQDGGSRQKSFIAEKIERTVLSSVMDTEFPHAFAAKREMQSWKFLRLNSDILRYPSSMLASPFLSSEGHNLAAMLVRMRDEDPNFLTDVAADLAYLVPGIMKVEVDTDQARNEYIVRVTAQDQPSFSSRVLSDGTLRMLALATLKNDPEHHGVLCFEEPETAVHPAQLRSVVQILRDLATNFQDQDQIGLPLRQLLVNTHSPTFVSQMEMQDALLFAYMVTRVKGSEREIPPHRVTRIVPVVKPYTQLLLDLGVSKEEEAYALAQMTNYLNGDSLNQARHRIAG